MIKNNINNFPELNYLKHCFIPNANISMCIAGGCFKSIFTKEKVKDIDIFFESEQDFTKYKKYFDQIFVSDTEYALIYETKNSIGYKHTKHHTRIDLVKSIYGKPENIINNFDFTIAKFALYDVDVDKVIDGKIVKRTEFETIYHDNFFEHLLTKKLVVDDKTPFPASTFNRMIRYIKYGFTPCRETKLRIINELRKLANENIDLAHELYESFD